HQIRKVLAIMKDLLTVAMQIVPVWSVPVEEMRVVVDAATHVPKRIVETLGIGHLLRDVAEMPFTDVPSCVTGGGKNLGDGLLLRWPPGGVAGDRRGIAGNSGPLWVFTGEQRCPRRRTDRGRGIKLAKP